MRKKLRIAALLLCAVIAFANIGSLSAQALADMTTEIVVIMGYVVEVLYAIASILAVYNATVIYIKLQSGEDGFVKAVMMLIASCIFLIAATAILPSFFRFNANFGVNEYSVPSWGDLF